MRVLLAAHHTLVRAGLKALVAQLPEVSEILEAADGQEAVEAVAAHHPEVVLMDIATPLMNGFEATAQILRIAADTKVIILSMHQSGQLVQRALRAGARGYLVKSAAVADLRDAILTVTDGKLYISPSIQQASGATTEPDDSAAIEPKPSVPASALTPRQREVLQLIAVGMTSREIARTLGIHFKTVDSHRTQLMKRLEIHDIAGLVWYAIRSGIAPIE
jgi:DNA-binding NarL/FixJ family response regulator